MSQSDQLPASSQGSESGEGARPSRRGNRVIIASVVGLASVIAAVSVWGALGGGDPGSGERAVASGSAVAGGSGVTVPDAGSVARGKSVYMGGCIACHGEHGEARPGLGKDLAHSAFVDGLSDEQLVSFLTQGRSPSDPLNTTGVQMPLKGGNPALNADDLRDVVAFLRSLKQE